MITRTLIAALVGISIVGGALSEASAAVANQSGTKTVAAQTIGGKQIRTVAAKHRMHVSHRTSIKRLKIAKRVGGKRLVVSHVVKKTNPKHV